MKKIISSILSLVMVLSMSTNAFAANINTDGDSKNVTVSYGMTQSFVVTIPSSIEMYDGYGASEITASNVLIPNGSVLNITVSSDDYVDKWELIDELNSSNRLVYHLYNPDNGDNFVNNSVVLSVNAGEAYDSVAYAYFDAFLDETATKAGRYTDTLTFTVSVENAVELISFIILDSPTNSEIYTTYYAEKDMTWEEWIGSKYSTEDFSITGSQILNESSYNHVYDNDENIPVRKSDTIISNGWYYLY